ncbi:MAG TPA: hypothetical protein VK823_29860 [Streptosporangiaceae bacterium]|jgi:hypothetical protein|nr:hypothetical protein [Streptosporangiaceae bacterium]
MTDLRVDYGLLGESHATLTSLISEFTNIQTEQGHDDWAIGSGDIAGQLDGFAGNWTYHRKQIIGSMQALDQMVTQSIKTFNGTDSQLAQALTKK